jgi:hypothetical protein
MPVALYQRCQPNRAWGPSMLMLPSLVVDVARAELGCSAGFACGGLTNSLPAPRQTSAWAATLAVGLYAFAVAVWAQPTTDQDRAASRFAIQAELRPVQISDNGRYTLEASARYAPEAKSSDGRFTLKVVNAPEGDCGQVTDQMFRDGFES